MYKILGLHFSYFLWLLWPLRFILRIHKQPNNLNRNEFRTRTHNKDVVFILPRFSLVDVFVLNLVLKQLLLPKVRVHATPHKRHEFSLLSMKPPVPLTPTGPETSEAFEKQLELVLSNDPRIGRKALVLQPVSVFWGRVPERHDRGFFWKMLFPDDGRANALQKLWIVLLHCRNLHVHFSDSVEPEILEDTEEAPSGTLEALRARRIRRLLQIQFSRERTVALGPELYDSSSLLSAVLASPATQKIIESDRRSRKRVEKEIIKNLREISADFNYLTALAFERALDFIWTKIFRGLQVRNFQPITKITKEGQVLWMPCHRSHFDYLLLSYLLKKRGLALPHIAAGVNLNFWPIGPVLRRSGAFFLRRTFHGNRIYSHTFAQYIDFLMQNGFPIEFFQEGGRTRIGKLLPPKRGLLNMCVSSIIQRHQENVWIIPIFIGYEKVLEDESYARELSGAKKKKENFFRFLASLKGLFDNYGRVDVSFGEPIHFGAYWNEYFTNNSSLGVPQNFADVPTTLDSRERSVQDFVRFLARRVNMGVNQAATASGTALLASVLLGISEQKTARSRVIERIKILDWVISTIRNELNWNVTTNRGAENSQDFILSAPTRTPDTPLETKDSDSEIIAQPMNDNRDLVRVTEEILQNAKNWGFVLEGEESDAERSLTRNPVREESLWWYRGTIFHLLAIPGIISTIILDLEPQNRNLSEISSRTDSLRNLWGEELFWHDHTSSTQIAQTGLKILMDLAVISTKDNELYQINEDERVLEHLYFFSDLVRPERELYSLQVTAALSLMETKGKFTQSSLIQKSLQAHKSAFLRGAAMQSAQHSAVFGRRVFEALVHVDIFRAVEDNHFVVASEKLSPILHFFETLLWRDFLT
jgi:glycerol-3-phosphate O-acyltransferase